MRVFVFLLTAVVMADTPDPPSSCYDSVMIDLTGIGDEPTCWFVSGNSEYTSPNVSEGDIHLVETPSGRVHARCTASLENDHGHAVRWDASNSCDTDPDVFCEIGLADGSNVITSDWQITVSASGRATLTCTYPD